MEKRAKMREWQIRQCGVAESARCIVVIGIHGGFTACPVWAYFRIRYLAGLSRFRPSPSLLAVLSSETKFSPNATLTITEGSSRVCR